MSKKISLLHQEGALLSYFPDSAVLRTGEQQLVWEGELQPTALSRRYRVRLTYNRTKGISVNVVSPKLELAAGATKLPHVYSTAEQKLCLYYPMDREWHSGLLMAKTIIPWASEWLFYYETWVLTGGKWLGGGIEHEEPLTHKKENNDLNEQENGK
ncbi:hypothetical protein [Chitinophaga sp. S165]|uniref:hypothetical protein n=1 Tax=Chitinophaga sp. S165 TaxID=2135462 RepID=UPI000D8C8AE1|nr:hypothetical protein [Chitinophaga sp. S165]PWV46219.1 hypothetical protein C7475_111122 [Chitinophaga sp. S165]